MRAAWLFLLPLALSAQAPLPPAERLADAALAFAKVEAAKLGGEHSFKVAQPPRVPTTRPGNLSFEASHLSKREPVGHFFVVVAIKVDGDRVGMTRVDLDGSWVGSVLRAKGDLARQTELTAEQVEPSPFEGVPPEGALTEIPEGQRLMRSVPSGRILTRGDLEAIPLVQSGDKVRLTATHETLTICLDTTARSRAGRGDRVRLEAPGARRQVTAVVTGPGEARLQ
ncbi:MAG: flagellar basal body P-ring formation protein FlgA [Geothrix sp.]|uniref:flagellar basal body P-ring formation chaperone FlgA n=1 Tax=Geothrix sp. TaxID=1962974 RepID=UPI0017A6348C|nr:flagellar basal body P-ring formation chaperone FlgA [Geothrix sp.]NWJ40066.1 flagellar basal body P-ring formation protein FlgA [Geothrix sp.]WIL21925.1 MAG: flagellar basal body P-ring formation chaperone FlgA [Geothrix sp.]